ncbi:MAG: ATP synthase subunit I [Ruminococcaceae bacterium]|nr:ATP synthase subunit I [Oscillospiraceae bacterium]
MKLQSASRKEIKRIAIGTAILDVLMIAAFALLGLLGILQFQPLSVILAAAIGSCLAIGSFTVLCITVQQAVEIEDRKKMQAKFQLSYNIRMVVQAAWVVICFFVPWLNIFAGALPLAFPKITILYLNGKGRLVEKSDVPGDDAAKEE